MARKSISLIAFSITCIMLSACIYENPHGSASITYPHVQLARQNAALALSYLHKGRTDLAQQQFDLALQQGPNDPLVLDALGFYYEKTGEIDLANQTFFKAVLIAPRSGTIRNDYGAFLCRNGYSHDAILYFLKASQAPHYVNAIDAYDNARFCAQQLGEKEEYAYYTKLLRKPFLQTKQN